MDRRRRNALYARILAVGLGVSVLVHAALLGFGRLSFLKRSPGSATLNVVTLPEPETQPEEEAGGAVDSWQLALELSESERAVLDLSEYQDVLAEAASTDPLTPVVPRPRLTAYVAESGFTPLRIPQPDRLTRRGQTVNVGPGGGMGGVIIVVGGGGMGPVDDCTPSGIGGRFPGGRRPIGPRR
ncbi:MAG: hypothetical protein JSV86_01170 [Gemmatimonadota bacterium]|nr:MAG: hypothetical protein JSV86_01170 [Gemmatimonadota bacterium]